MTETNNQNLAVALGLPPEAAPDAVEGKFLDIVRARIQSVAETYDEAAVQAEETTLRALHTEFFRFMMLWATAEMKKPQDHKDHPDAAKQKKRAKTLIESLQQNIIEFALCYMHINRFTTLLRDEIRRAEIKMGGPAPANVKWTADTGLVINRYRKQKEILLHDLQRFADVRDELAAVDADLLAIRQLLIALFGSAEKAEPYMRRFVASLRTAEFKRARNAVREIAEAKKKFGLDQKTQDQQVAMLEAAAARIIDIIEKNQKKLASRDDGKLFLRPVEADLAYNANVRELQKIKGFLAKYHLPYMEYKMDTLFHLKEKLMVVGSLDSLMVLYRRLVAGVARPLPDIREVRLYESEVLDKTSYMLEGQFQEIPKILARAYETVQEFRDSNRDFEQTAALADFHEVAVDEQQAAAGT